ncbi:MAG: DUF1461 domain-containing protein [Candidatus Woesearchaeota archaeon]|nr:DUF1461 domain-containing protein [Candidatus Woesearchaeota archaeon]
MAALKIGSKKAMGNTIIPKLVFSAFIFLILIYSSVMSVLDIKVLEYGFSRYGVYEIFSEEEAQERAQDILDFFDTGSGFQYFNEDEQSHLMDVKILLDRFSIAAFFSMLIILFWILLDKGALDYLMFSSIFSLIALVLVIAPFVVDFSFMFQKFHELFFAGNYSFDPKVSEMKALFPDAFFMYLAVMVLVKLALKSACILMVQKIFAGHKKIRS